MDEKTLERASRFMCQLMGRDPDSIIPVKDDGSLIKTAGPTMVPLWKVMEPQVKHWCLIAQAVDMAVRSKGEVQEKEG